jgi:hypothetical protein
MLELKPSRSLWKISIRISYPYIDLIMLKLFDIW